MRRVCVRAEGWPTGGGSGSRGGDGDDDDDNDDHDDVGR